MAARSFFKQILFLLSLAGVQSGYAQCTTCNTLVTNNSVSSYTVNSGQTLCIFANLTYTGSITLNGGTVCNNGIISKLIVRSGTFNNNFQGRLLAAAKSDLVFNLNGKAVFNNFSESRLELGDSLNVRGGALDTLFLNIHQSSWASCDDFTHFTGNLALNLGLPETSSLVTDTVATFNVNGNFTSVSDLNSEIKEKGFLNVNGTFTFADKGIKTLNNHGVLNTLSDFYITGDADSEGSVTFNNYGEFYSQGFSANIVNAPLVINVYMESTRSVFYLPYIMFLGTTGAGLMNEGVVLLDGGLQLQNGTVDNNRYLEVAGLTMDGGTLTNEGVVVVNGDVLIQPGISSVLNNYSNITISGQLTNNGIINLGENSILVTNDLSNESTGEIHGTTGVPSVTDYPKIVIFNNSANYGKIRKQILITDQTTSTTGDDVDVKGPESDIDEDVIFLFSCDQLVPAGFFLDHGPRKLPKTDFCLGEKFGYIFKANFGLSSGPTWNFTGSAAGTAYSGSTFAIIGVNSSGYVSVSGTYTVMNTACPFEITIPVNVITGSITTTSPVHFGVGNPVTLSSSVITGAPPIQYTWTPNIFFTQSGSNSQSSATVMPQVSMIYTVSMRDAYGCTGSNTVEVIGEPFASLDKELNGEYYKLYDNQLFFRHEGQYDQSSFRYYVYDKAHTVVASASSNLVNSLSIKPGDNRLTLNASSLATGYYVLEVINEKNEKTYLRFQR